MKTRFAVIGLIACIAFCIAGFVVVTKDGGSASTSPSIDRTTKSERLEDFSISIMVPPGNKYGYSPNFIPEPKKLYFLNNPKNGNCVALVLVKSDGSVFLNPSKKELQSMEFNYGPIPNLPDFTANVADRLFGAGENTSVTVKTYTLDVKGSDSSCYLDLQFSGNHLDKYRIRSPIIVSQDWIAVKRA